MYTMGYGQAFGYSMWHSCSYLSWLHHWNWDYPIGIGQTTTDMDNIYQ